MEDDGRILRNMIENIHIALNRMPIEIGTLENAGERLERNEKHVDRNWKYDIW